MNFKKAAAIILTAVIVILSFAGCSANKNNEQSTESVSESELSSEEASKVVFAEFISAKNGTPVEVKAFVQAKTVLDGGKGGEISLYAQSVNGAYYIENMKVSGDEYEKLTEGREIAVRGIKSDSDGWIKISSPELVSIGEKIYVADPVAMTKGYQTGDLYSMLNEKLSFTNLTVTSSEDADSNEVPFIYKRDGTGEEGDDIYFTASDGKSECMFVVSSKFNPSYSDLYKTCQSLKTGDIINVTGFMGWSDNLAEVDVMKIEKSK